MASGNTNHTRRPRILIVDDDPGQRSLLDSFLKSQGFATTTVASGEQALAALRSESFAMMISDVRMPGISGLETLRLARKEFARLPVLLVTAFADIRDAVNAMRDGALNYLSKPIDLDELLRHVQQATGLAKDKPVRVDKDRELPPYVVARSPQMLTLFRDAALIAGSESRVMISGESGVGKEVLVDIIHAWSPRVGKPLVKVNCAAIPETLLEAELFGHERGAFTGAVQQRIGRFEQANGGTLFLDEIGEMSPPLQAKLLRVTQNGTFQRVGSNTELKTDTRILASTNRNLEEAVKKGQFREDLFYRLNVVEFCIPPLRERPEDILPLAQIFMEEFSEGKARLSPAVVDCLTRYNWPGNVRELRNAMERAALLSRGEMVLPEHLPARVQTATAKPPVQVEPTEARRLEQIEHEAMVEALKKANFNRTEAAKTLGISRRTLVYKLQRLRDQGFEVDAP